MKNLLSIARNQIEATRKTPRILPNGVPLRFYQKRDSRLVGISCSDGLVFAGQFAGDWSLTILRDMLRASRPDPVKTPVTVFSWGNASVSVTGQAVLRAACHEE
jgi:hypothetical protein